MRHFMFIDESGEACVLNNDPRFNAFVLCAVIFREDHYQIFDNEMKRLKSDVFGDPEIVFHSYHMRAKKGDFVILKDLELQARFYERIGEIFKHQQYTVIACVINKDSYKERYPETNQAYEESLKFICERSILNVSRKSKSDTIHICLEQRQKGKDALLKKHYTRFRRYGTDYVSTEDFQMLSERLTFRGKNNRINGLEFADLCAYPIAKASMNPDIIQPTYEAFKHRINCDYRGKIEGIGIKRFP